MNHSPYSVIKHPSELSENELSMMFNLLTQYYDACSYNNFCKDLSEKTHVLIFQENNTSSIVGFTTAQVMSFEIDHQELKAIYSGDTVIHHNYRGTQLLPLSWCEIVGHIKAESNGVPLYWFLIVKGHRTYRYLPLFAKRFYPTWRYPTPSNIQRILDTMAGNKFGDSYQAESGIIHFSQSKGHLNEKSANIPEHLLKKPDVSFFLNRNPNYYKGDELACITELTEENLKSHALRAFQSAAQC